MKTNLLLSPSKENGNEDARHQVILYKAQGENKKME